LRKIGRVLHISPSKKAVIKVEKTPRIGETVLDEKQRQIGTVSDIFGPIVSPYVEVEVKVKDPQEIINNILYVSSSPKHETRSRRK